MNQLFNRLDPNTQAKMLETCHALEERTAMAATINLDQFEIFTMPEGEWFKKFFRVDIKYHDELGKFGPKRYDYFIYWKGSSVDAYGASNPHILICTPRSLSKMRPDRKEVYKQIFRDKGVDLDEVERDKLVVAAKDQAFFSSIGKESMTLFFVRTRIKKEE